ncbi:unnamed protein product [Phytophthora fragariaefolia]|uniref:Unnamed protein product n=1 Tax=Phytophthora fragariaefolia TaxID=1490495 RepID=A0A9W6XUS7_9STRA|nr:unnamed protein product [Phytophthora fragariaefolia]
MLVAGIRRQDPYISEADIRVTMSKTNLVLNDTPIVTNNWMDEFIAESDESMAYATRDIIWKTFGGVVDDHVQSGASSNGTYFTVEEYAFKVADKAATFYAIWDVWGVASTLSEYLQPICGPTEYIGEINDVLIDTDDVTVNIKSGGDKIDEFDVAAGETMTWKSNVTALGGKTLNLDRRWRPGWVAGSSRHWWWLPAIVDPQVPSRWQFAAVLNLS